MTGCDNNSELKVWSCELWTCLQTIKFAPNPSTGKMPVLKAGLDLSAGYLFLSDIYNKVLYILSLSKDKGEAVACVSTVSEFLLPYPILSFGIIEADQRKIRTTGESLEDLCEEIEENDEHLVVSMYLVQPKSLQECNIAFKPASQASNCRIHTLTHDSLDYNEDLPDTVNHNGVSGENCEEDRSLSGTIETTINHSTGGLNLMTPDAFSSPAKKENNELESNSGSPELEKLSDSPSLAQAVQALNASDPQKALAENDMEEQAPASYGSSPSREVREILSTKPDEETEIDSKPEMTTNADENWSNIPMVLFKDVQAMQESEAFAEDDETNVQRQNTKDEPKTPSLSGNDTGASWRANNDLNNIEMNNNLKSILEITQDQYQELKELRAEIARLRQESPATNRIESTFARMSQQQNATLEQTLYNQMARQREFLNTFETVVKDKIENTLPRTIEETVKPLKQQMRLEANQMDELFQKNVTELISSAHVKDTLALTAANAAKPALDAAFKETFTNVLLPGMEKMYQVMFKQIQDTFIKGTRECK